MNEQLPEYVKKLLYATENQLLEDRIGRAINRMFGLGVAGQYEFEELNRRVEKHRIRQAFGPPFPEPRLNSGDIVLGMEYSSGRPIHSPLSVFAEPILTIGSTGCGKTTKSLFWNAQIATKAKGHWIFDFRKSGLRILRSILHTQGVELNICRARDLRLNPLQVPFGVDPRDFCDNSAQMFVQMLKLPQRASKLWHITQLKLYESFGVLAGGENYPTLFDFHSAVAAEEKANPPAKHAVLDSVARILASLGEVLAFNYGWTTRDLAKRHILFELGGVSDAAKNLIVNTLVHGEFLSRVAQGIENRGLTLFISCDEAARLLGSADDSISDLICVARGTGIGLDLSLQTAQVSKAVLSNTPNKFIGRVTSYADLDVVGSSIGLTQEQRRWMMHHLDRGIWVGQLSQGDRRPFVFRTPNIDFRRFSPDDWNDDAMVQPDVRHLH
jgi:hypothetical protein